MAGFILRFDLQLGSFDQAKELKFHTNLDFVAACTEDRLHY